MPSSSRCVILVDDEQNILNSLKRELRDWAGKLDLEILTAISGRKGLELLAEKPQRREHRVGRGLAQPAQAGAAHHVGERLQIG